MEYLQLAPLHSHGRKAEYQDISNKNIRYFGQIMESDTSRIQIERVACKCRPSLVSSSPTGWVLL
jgi:hypothetical protein